MKPSHDDMESLPVELIDEYRSKGDLTGVPDHLKEYIKHLNRASEIFAYEHNISRAAKELQLSFPKISLITARRRLYDAINRFHLNSTVTEEAWNNYYADRMEDLSKIAIADNNWTEARRCIEKAREYRNEAAIKRVDPNMFKLKVQVIDPSVTAEKLGLEEFNLRKVWLDTETFIEELPVDDNQKSRLKNEASLNLGAQDIDHEEIE